MNYKSSGNTLTVDGGVLQLTGGTYIDMTGPFSTPHDLHGTWDFSNATTVDFTGTTVTGLPTGGSSFIDATNSVTKTAGNLTFSGGSIILNDSVPIAFGTANPITAFASGGANTKLDIQSTSGVTGTAVRFLDSGGTAELNIEFDTGNVTATGSIRSTSDSRIKENIITVDNRLRKGT